MTLLSYSRALLIIYIIYNSSFIISSSMCINYQQVLVVPTRQSNYDETWKIGRESLDKFSELTDPRKPKQEKALKKS